MYQGCECRVCIYVRVSLLGNVASLSSFHCPGTTMLTVSEELSTDVSKQLLLLSSIIHLYLC